MTLLWTLCHAGALPGLSDVNARLPARGEGDKGARGSKAVVWSSMLRCVGFWFYSADQSLNQSAILQK